MRLLLAVLAVLTMLAGPAFAAARTDCSGAIQPTASAVDVPTTAAMDTLAMAEDAAMPCCPDAKQKSDQPQKPDGKGCAQMCAAMNGVAVAVAPVSFAKTLISARVVLTNSDCASARSFKPLGLERPPKRIA